MSPRGKNRYTKEHSILCFVVALQKVKTLKCAGVDLNVAAIAFQGEPWQLYFEIKCSYFLTFVHNV